MNLTTLSELKKAFNSALEQSTDKQFLIENELREVNNFITNLPVPKVQKRFLVKYHPSHKGTGVFNLAIPQGRDFSEAFSAIVRTGEFKIEKSFHEPIEAFEIKQTIVQQASDFAEYYKWLNSLKNSPQKVIRKNDLTHGEKLLALHYLGLDLRKFDFIKSAKVLEPIIGQNFDDTRKQIPLLYGNNNKIMKKKNLETVLQLFENVGFEEIAKRIKTDIEKNK